MNMQLWFWSIVSLVFFILEIGHPGLFYFLSFCLAAFSSGMLALFGYSLFIQMVSFFLATIGAIFLMRLCIKKMRQTVHATNVTALIGKEGIVTEAINQADPGYVKIQGELWLARSLAKVPLQRGTVIRVVRISGAHVVVDPVK